MLRRLRDVPQIAAFEQKAVLDRRWCQDEPDRDDRIAIDDASREVFGTTEFEVWPDDESDPAWAAFYAHSDDRLVFEPLGWDITDDYGRPMLILEHFSHQLYAAIKGIAGRLPDEEPAKVDAAWETALQADAVRFKGRK